MVINNRGSMVTVSGKDPDEMARLVEGVAYLNTRHALTHSIYNSSKFIFRSEGVKSMRKVTESAQNELRVSLSQKERSLQGTEEKLSSQNSKLIYPKFPESKSLIVISTIKRKNR